ncbi:MULTISPECIES: helix-turn-helix transcriptional regulator [unclassified Marinovum]
MKRADRLYRLMELLKDGSLHRAEDLARGLGVSVRTIYRDMDTLIDSGVPVMGERGLGYSAQAAITLPPINLTDEELEALHLGLAVVGQSGEPEMAEAALSLAAKIDALLPEDHAAPAQFSFAAYPFEDAARGFRHMPAFRAAVRARQKLRITLADGARHVLRPLELRYWGRIWACVGWSETTGDFAAFRIDQIETLSPVPGLFVEEPGKRLQDYQA